MVARVKLGGKSDLSPQEQILARPASVLTLKNLFIPFLVFALVFITSSGLYLPSLLGGGQGQTGRTAVYLKGGIFNGDPGGSGEFGLGGPSFEYIVGEVGRWQEEEGVLAVTLHGITGDQAARVFVGPETALWVEDPSTGVLSVFSSGRGPQETLKPLIQEGDVVAAVYEKSENTSRDSIPAKGFAVRRFGGLVALQKETNLELTAPNQ